jgi:hypothetical protein
MEGGLTGDEGSEAVRNGRHEGQRKQGGGAMPPQVVTRDIVVNDERGTSGSSDWVSGEATIRTGFELRFPSSVEVVRRRVV